MICTTQPGCILAASRSALPASRSTTQLRRRPLKGLRGQGCADAASWTGTQTQGRGREKEEKESQGPTERSLKVTATHTHPHSIHHNPYPTHTHKHINPTLTSTEMEGADPLVERTGAAREGKPDGNTENKMICRHSGALNQL